MHTPFVPEAFSLKGEELAETSALMFGRRSYEAFAPVWPGSEDHAGYKELPKYVVSSTLPDDALVEVADFTHDGGRSAMERLLTREPSLLREGLARLLDDKPMPVRDKGPLFIIYPFDSKPELRNAVYAVVYEQSLKGEKVTITNVGWGPRMVNVSVVIFRPLEAGETVGYR